MRMKCFSSENRTCGGWNPIIQFTTHTNTLQPHQDTLIQNMQHTAPWSVHTVKGSSAKSQFNTADPPTPHPPNHFMLIHRLSADLHGVISSDTYGEVMSLDSSSEPCYLKLNQMLTAANSHGWLAGLELASEWLLDPHSCCSLIHNISKWTYYPLTDEAFTQTSFTDLMSD